MDPSIRAHLAGTQLGIDVHNVMRAITVRPGALALDLAEATGLEIHRVEHILGVLKNRGDVVVLEHSPTRWRLAPLPPRP